MKDSRLSTQQLDFIDSELRKRQEITRQIRLQRDLLNEKNRTRGMKTANELYDVSGQGKNRFGGMFGGFFGKRRVTGRDVLKQDDSIAAKYSQGVLKIIQEFGLV